MISRRRTSKDTVSDRKSNFRSLVFEKHLREWIFAIQQSRGSKKEIRYRDFGRIPRNSLNLLPVKTSVLRDAIHTHFFTLIGKWTISFLPIHSVFLSAPSRDVKKLLYFNLVTLQRLSTQCLTQPPKIVHLPISVTKWVWMASLIYMQ